ncbi:MAG: secretin N-terminal domain-containing protein, partial [Woeseia sp.]
MSALLAACLVLSGCASLLPQGDEPAPADSIDTALEEAARPAPPPPARESEMPRPFAERPAAVPDEVRFNVNSSNTDAGEFFMALVDGTEHNIVVHPDVTGQISLTLKNVTVDEVLDVVSDVYGYAYRRSSAGYVVLPASVQSRIFQIDYLNLQRSGSSRTRVSSGQVSEGGRRNGRGNIGATGSGIQDLYSGGGIGSGGQSQDVSGSRIETTYEADFWSELESTVQSIVGPGDGHQVVVNAQSGVVVVSAMPDKLRDVEEYLVTIQTIAQRQVILEAKIIEVRLNDAFQAGINWVAVAQNSSGDTYTFGQTAPPPDFPVGLSNLGGNSVTVSPGTVVEGFVNSTMGGAFTMAFDIGDFNSFIELLESQGDTRVLSSPRVSTLNNQKAVIKAGSDEFFVTNVSSN